MIPYLYRNGSSVLHVLDRVNVRMLDVVEADGIILETGYPPAVCAMALENVRLVLAKVVNM